jgi:hypothetical protein
MVRVANRILTLLLVMGAARASPFWVTEGLAGRQARGRKIEPRAEKNSEIGAGPTTPF